MSIDSDLAGHIRELLGKSQHLSEKKMFGGLGFLLNGNICCGVWKEFLILRLGDEVAPQVLRELHARPFDITGRAMRGWAMIEPAGWSDQQRLRRWVSWAIAFTESLPAK
jgi:TfoX/Sxy family transcriptional regulator of competence genes